LLHKAICSLPRCT